MSLDAHSPEFNQLVLRWLDETATPEEAARLWQAVGASPECAREMAALSRFDALVESTVMNRAGARQADRQFQKAQAAPERPRRLFARPLGRALVAAAAVILVGAMAWSLWPAEEAMPQVAGLTDRKKPDITRRVQLPRPGQPPAMTAQAAVSEKSLPERLDSFFLPRVSLKQVPLREALGLLQGQLLELNHLKAEALDKLRVTVPADASQRRITFESGPIAFLKAVRAVAALGGCDVAVDEASLALILHPEIYPQQPEKKDVMSLLAGLTNLDGHPAAEDPQRVAALVADAVSLGITGDVTAGTPVPVTRGQWVALQMLTEARQQRLHLVLPAFNVYLVEEGSEQQDRVLTEGEVEQIQKQNVAPVLQIPSGQMLPLGPDFVKGGPSIQVEPQGEVITITIPMPINPGGSPADMKLAANDGNAYESRAMVIGPGQAGLLTLVDGSGAGMAFTGKILPGSTLSFSTSGTVIGQTNGVIFHGGAQVIVVPQNPVP